MFLTLCITKDSNMLVWFNKPRRCFWRNLDLGFASLMLFYTCLTVGIIYSIIYFRGYMFFFYIPRCQSTRLCVHVFFTSRGKWMGTYFFSHFTNSVYAIVRTWYFCHIPQFQSTRLCVNDVFFYIPRCQSIWLCV